MRVLELFSGIGGVAAAIEFDASHPSSPCPPQLEVVAALDINQLASIVYRENFSASVFVEELSSLSANRIRDFDCDLWWMSPPCQPYTRRGLRQDASDPRAEVLLHLIKMLREAPPKFLALENVFGFEGSRAHSQLRQVLSEVGFDVAEINLCSTMFGIPNLRPRFFLAASRVGQVNLKQPRGPTRKSSVPQQNEPVGTVAEFLDSERELDRWGQSLWISPELIQKYYAAINICTPDSRLTRCFTSAYGNSVVRSGSYLQIENEYRRFSPSEVARLLGLPVGFKLPESLTTRQLWKLLGNSVSVPCVRWVLQSLTT